MSQSLVRLWKRPCKKGQEYKYTLIWKDETGRQRMKALGHADERKAERQRAQKERELRMGMVEPDSMRLSEFVEDSIKRTRGQVRDSTLREARITMDSFIKAVGDINYRAVTHRHGERFIQACRDAGNSPATVAKKIRHLKRIFQLAVERQQLEENPLRYVKQPRVPRKPVRIFDDDECRKLIAAAKESRSSINWELLFKMALCTGMRRGELLNTIWPDIDFEKKTVVVTPKRNTAYTWEWHIKDTDRRTLPLTDEVIGLLARYQTEQPEGCPYVFVPAGRFEHIQRLRETDNWSVEKGKKPLNNFNKRFDVILSLAGIRTGTFHDFRRTCLSNWAAAGLTEFDVMTLAGHSSFETTRNFYLAIKGDLVERARKATKSQS